MILGKLSKYCRQEKMMDICSQAKSNEFLKLRSTFIKKI
jgi:hypothetical protein